MQQQIEKQNRKVNEVLELLTEFFKSFNMSFVLLKGQGLAQLYPKPLLRNSGDIDIYLGCEGYEMAKMLLENNTWLKISNPHEDIKHFSCGVNGVMVELHYCATLIPGKRQNEYLQRWLEDECRRLLRNGQWVCLPPMANVVYTFIHLFIHFIGGGVSMKQLLDVAMLVKRYGSEIDHTELETRLRETGFLKAWQVFGCVMVNYLGFGAADYPCYDSQYEGMADKVVAVFMEDGNRQLDPNRRRDKVSIYLRVMKGYLRLMGLFPLECVSFLGRQIHNTASKYINLMKGGVHKSMWRSGK